MSLFLCSHCDEWLESDNHGCEENPSDPSKQVCTSCAEEIEESLQESENPMKAYGLKEGDFL